LQKLLRRPQVQLGGARAGASVQRGRERVARGAGAGRGIRGCLSFGLASVVLDGRCALPGGIQFPAPPSCFLNQLALF